jgi:hypothetical protein
MRYNTAYEGRYISELASQAGKSPYDWLFGALLESELDISMMPAGLFTSSSTAIWLSIREYGDGHEKMHIY